MELVIQLHTEDRITIPGKPFEESDIREIVIFLAQDVIEIIRFDPRKHEGQQIWKTRFV